MAEVWIKLHILDPIGYLYMFCYLWKFSFHPLPSFNHKTDCEHVHFTSASDASDSDGEDDDNQSDASVDDESTIENPTSSPPGYISTNICMFISLISICNWLMDSFTHYFYTFAFIVKVQELTVKIWKWLLLEMSMKGRR